MCLHELSFVINEICLKARVKIHIFEFELMSIMFAFDNQSW